ncbi:MAG: glycosyltransferase family 39 protein [Anaerolineales bacterium]
MHRLRAHLGPWLGWTLLVGLLFWPVLAGQRSIPPGDLTGQFYAIARFQQQELRAGRLPVWSPGSYAGAPFAGDIQSAAFYPLRLLVLALAPSPLPFLAIELEAVLHLWLAGLFCYLLLVELTGRREAGLVAAVAFGLGGYLTGYPLLQLAILETVTWLPLALWLARRAARAERPVPWLVGLGLTLANLLLAGHPQTSMHAAYLVAAYYLWSSWRAHWRPRWILCGGALVIAVALGGAAAAWLPALHYLPLTVRGDVSYRFVQAGLPLTDLVQVLVPGALTVYSAMYVGVPSLLLALAAWWGARGTVDALAVETRFWAGAALVAGLLALGDDGVLFALAYRLLPGVRYFRQQERWLALFSLALAVLAGLGVARWLHGESSWRRPWRRAAWTLAALWALSGAMLAVMLGLAQGQWGWLRLWGLSAVLGALSVALVAPRRAPSPRNGGRVGARYVALTLLLAGDLAAVGLRAVPRVPVVAVPSASLAAEATILTRDDDGGPVRIDPREVGQGNLGEFHGLESVRGVSPLRPAALDALQTLPDAHWRQLLDVGYVLSEAPLKGEDAAGLERVGTLPAGTLWGQEAEALIYREPAVLGRAWLVHEVVTVGDADEALARLADESLDLARTVVLSTGATPAAVAPSDAVDTVTVARSSPSALQITTDSAAPGYLVISEWANREWRATLDGVDAPLLRADYALQALAVPAGQHTVRLWYAGRDVRLGLAVSLLTVVLGLALAWRVRRPVARGEWRPAWPATWRSCAAALAAVGQRAGLWARRWARAVLDASWLPWALLALGLGLRLCRLGAQELRGDEAFSYLMALRPTREIIAVVMRLGDPHSPLHYVLLHGWMRLAGVSEAALRLPSAVWGTLAVPVAWAVGQVTGGRRRAALLALIAAIAEPLVWVGQDVRSQYVLALWAYALATLLLLRQANEPRAGWRAWLRWLGYACCCAASVYAFYYAALALLGHVAYVLVHRERRRLLRPYALSLAAALALFAPWLVASLPGLLGSGQLADPGDPRLARFIVNSVTYLTAGETWPRAWVRGLAVVTIPLAVVGTRSLRRRDPALLALALTAVASTGLGAYLAQYLRSTYEQRYLLVAMLPWWLLLLGGVEELLAAASRWRRSLGAVALVGLLLLNGVSLGHLYVDPDFSRSQGYRPATAWMRAQAQAGDVFVANAPDPCWDYYLRDVALPRTMVPASAAADDAEDIAAAWQALGETYDRLWFAPQRNAHWDADGLAGHWLAYNALRERQATFDKVTVAAYRPLRTAEAVLRPVAAALDNGITLEGVYLTVAGEPATGEVLTLMPGQELAVTLAWRAEQPVAGRYTAFVHVVDEHGALLAQHDGVPVWGTRPTDVWQAGELVLDEHTLTLPADAVTGTVQLLVGLYDSETIARAHYANGADALVVARATLAAAQ